MDKTKNKKEIIKFKRICVLILIKIMLCQLLEITVIPSVRKLIII